MRHCCTTCCEPSATQIQCKVPYLFYAAVHGPFTLQRQPLGKVLLMCYISTPYHRCSLNSGISRIITSLLRETSHFGDAAIPNTRTFKRQAKSFTDASQFKTEQSEVRKQRRTVSEVFFVLLCGIAYPKTASHRRQTRPRKRAFQKDKPARGKRNDWDRDASLSMKQQRSNPGDASEVFALPCWENGYAKSALCHVDQATTNSRAKYFRDYRKRRKIL